MAVLSGALLSGVALAPAASAAEPVVGACYDYPAAAAKKPQNPAGPVPCEGPHTAEAYFLTQLPTAFPEPSTASPRQVVDAVANACTLERAYAYLGLTPDLPTRFQSYGVFPTTGQWSAGDHWLRCDVTIRSGTGLGKWTGSGPAWVASQNPTSFRYCTPSTGYAQVPSPNKTQVVPCTNPPKQWIMVSTPSLGKIWSKYPGNKALNAKATRACKSMKDVYAGGLPNLARGWYYIIPTSKGWADGRRTASCFVPLKQFLGSTPAPA